MVDPGDLAYYKVEHLAGIWLVSGLGNERPPPDLDIGGRDQRLRPHTEWNRTWLYKLRYKDTVIEYIATRQCSKTVSYDKFR